MIENKSLTYVEVDIPYCALTYGVAPCTASIPTTGDIKCFNSLGTCQDRDNFTDLDEPGDSPRVPTTLRFAIDTSYLPKDIECLPYISDVQFTPAIVSLDGDLGQRASLKVSFCDRPHSDTGAGFDKYLSDRDYDPFTQGTFFGKFRARHPFLRGRALRLIRGVLGDALADMDTRHYVIDSFDGPTPDGIYTLVAKDILKLADGDRAIAPALSNGFLVADILAADTALTLSPAGIGNSDYPATGYATIGGNEVCQFYRDTSAGNDANCLLLLHFDGANGATSTVDSSSSARVATRNGDAQISTAQAEFLQSCLFDGSGDFWTFPDSADWTFAGNFTIECFARFSSLAASRALFGHGSASTNQYRLIVATNGAVTFEVISSSSVIVTMTSAAGAAVINAWAHWAVVRSGNVWTLYKNGVSVATTTDADAIPNYAGTFRVGADGNSANGMAGWIDEFRVSNMARWMAAFTPPVAPYQSSGDILALVRGQLNTEAVDHDTSDRVQLVLRYVGERGSDIIADLLETYAGVDSSYVPIDAWNAEDDAFLARVYTLNIAEPTSVAKLIADLLKQMGAAIWWDDKNQLVRLQILRAVGTTADRFNEDQVMEESLEVKEQPDKRRSRVIIYFGQIDPTKKIDDLSNYRSSELVKDDQSETDEGQAIEIIYAYGVAAGGRTVATRMGELYLSRYVRAPRRFNLDLFRYAGQEPLLGSGYRLGGGTPWRPSWPFQDATGARVDAPIQVTRVGPEADRFKVEAEEMLFTAFGGDIDPTARTIIFDANENNINLRTRHDELYPEPESGDTVAAIINAGVIIGSSSTALRAFDVGGWPAGVTLSLQLQGRIEGCGGDGGNAGEVAQPGLPGGTALYTRQAISLDVDEGEIFGGGGGGGGGSTFVNGSIFANAGGGGGGAGKEPGSGGGGLGAPDGATGSEDAGGAGGVSPHARSGGDGGDPGLPGSVGGTPGGAAGGAAGAAIDGVSFVTVTEGPGDIRGGQVN